VGDLCVGCTEDTHQKMSENIKNFATRAKNIRKKSARNCQRNYRTLDVAFYDIFENDFSDIFGCTEVYKSL